MATQKEAREILDQVAEELRRLGAHSLYVASGKDHGVRGAVIRAWVAPGSKRQLPLEVSRTINGKDVTVPIKIEHTATMKPE
jgi:hypothetical protein